MNDPNRKIDVNISSLLSLKAELLRKQGEVNASKARQAAQPFVPRSFEKPANRNAKPAPEQPLITPIELEDNEQLERSRKILQAKSKFYDRMAASGGSVNSDDTCLVMFNAKKQSEKIHSEGSSSDESEENNVGPEEESEDWVEYTDSLGRTRKCLHADLEFFKKRDAALAKDFGDQVPENPQTSIPTPAEELSSSSESEDELLKTGRQIQQMREEWEKQEAENKDKEFVHYQDVLYDEARTHGVSYFQFSKDAEERAKQQKELDAVRKATLSAQKERDDQRSARERIIAERVLAAKNRQRARLGLPPLEKMDEPEPLKLEEKAAEEAAKKSAKKSEEDTAKELERKSHLRPWDEGKEGTSHLVSKEEAEWAYKAHREPMSQEKWNETKRGERKSEFAPTPDLNESPKTKKSKRKESTDAESPTKPEQSVAAPDVPMMDEDAEDEVEEKPGLYFTTKKKKLKRRNYQPEDTSPPRSSSGAEVPPPPTFDYYAPPLLGLSSKRPKPELPASSLVTSIEAGLKFLRNQTDKSQSSSQSLWGANANYGKDM